MRKFSRHSAVSLDKDEGRLEFWMLLRDSVHGHFVEMDKSGI